MPRRVVAREIKRPTAASTTAARDASDGGAGGLVGGDSDLGAPTVSAAKFALMLVAAALGVGAALHGAALALFSKGFLLNRLELDFASTCAFGAVDSIDLNINDHRNSTAHYQNCWGQDPPRFARAVLIIIDALRFDFALYKPEMDPSDANTPNYINRLPVFHEILTNQPGHGFLARIRADAPTTTLQRLKALTTGTLPTFVDAGNNFGGSAITEDNLIDQLVVRMGKKIFFVGDDTWTSIYPTQFNESHPYDSFNVQDLHTVDNGCVEHLFPALNRESHDWDLAIAHFLGVDHAGHSFGPSTVPMQRKLEQTNYWLQKVFDSVQDDTVVFVIGDHGMDPMGNHGGDSDGEINAALFAYSKGKPLVNVAPTAHSEMNNMLKSSAAAVKYLDDGDSFVFMQGSNGDGYRTFPQIDVVPTLALLLGAPIPFGNLGTIIPELFYVGEDPVVALRRLVDVSLMNAHQIFRYLSEYSTKRPSIDFGLLELKSHLDAIDALHSRYLDTNATDLAKDIHVECVLFMRKALVSARRNWARFDVPLMILGLVVFGLSIVVTIVYACVVWHGDGSIGFTIPQAAFFGNAVTAGLISYATGIVGKLLKYFMSTGSAGEGTVMDRLDEVLFLSSTAGMLSYAFTALGESLRVRSRRTRAICGDANCVQTHEAASFVYLPQRTPKPIIPTSLNIVFALTLLFLHSFAPASNSYTIHEESITTFLIQTFALYSLAASQSLHRSDSRSSLMHASIWLMILTRISHASTTCREETAATCEPTFNFVPNSSLASPSSIFFLVLAAVLAVSLIKNRLDSTQNMQSTAGFVVSYFMPAGLTASCIYWTIDTLLGHNIFHDEGHRAVLRFTRLWIAKIAFLSVSCSMMYIWATEASAVGVHKSTDGTKIVVSGVKNPIGSGALVVLGIVYVILGFFAKPLGGVMLAVGLGQLICVVEMFATWRDDAELFAERVAEKAAVDAGTAKGERRHASKVDLGLLMLHGVVVVLIGHRIFFATGHQNALSTIMWEIGFVGLESVHWVASGLMVALNTFAGPILAVFATPLLVTWRRPLSAHTQTRTIKEITFSMLFHVAAMSIHAFLAAVFTAHFRRHLMVWKIFAPKFLFASVELLLVDAVMLIFVSGSVFVAWAKHRETWSILDRWASLQSR